MSAPWLQPCQRAVLGPACCECLDHRVVSAAQTQRLPGDRSSVACSSWLRVPLTVRLAPFESGDQGLSNRVSIVVWAFLARERRPSNCRCFRLLSLPLPHPFAIPRTQPSHQPTTAAAFASAAHRATRHRFKRSSTIHTTSMYSTTVRYSLLE